MPRIRKTVTLALTVCMAAALLLSTATPAYADSKQQELEAQKDQVQQQLDAAKKELTAIQNNKSDAEAEKTALQNQANLVSQQVGLLVNQIDDTQDSIDAKQQEIDTKQTDIDAKQADIDARWSDFKLRMAAMQELNDGGAIAMLSSASNLYELLTFSETLQEIYDKDSEVLAAMNKERSDLDAQKQVLETAKADLVQNQAALQDQRSQLDSKRDELATYIKAQDKTISDAQAQEEAKQAEVSAKQSEFDKATDELDSYIRSLIQQTQKDYENAPISCSLNFICPLNSYKYISCYYGDNGHKGVDFAAPANTEIHAVASGVVTTAAWHSSYGNYVIVYHGVDDKGNTYATLYAHMISAPPVSTGQSITQGQVIGYVGSTGNSTGNHLHLELRVNGARTNPLNYVPH